MPIPQNAQTEWTGTPKVLEASGASIGNNAIVQADDASYSRATDGEGAVDLKIVVTATFSVAPTEGTALIAYARERNIAGAGNHANVPEALLPGVVLGAMQVNNVTTLQNLACVARGVPPEFDVYIHNAGTGQTMSAGWTCTVIPITPTPVP